MRFVFKTTTANIYSLNLPNYYDVTNVKPLVDELKTELPIGEEIVEYHFYRDGVPTLEERAEIDLHGEVINPPIELLYMVML